MSKSERMALVSVHDKTGVVALAKGLSDIGFDIVSTGGTFLALTREGVPCSKVETLTGFPEVLEGRVKTLHPAVFGGILGRRGSAKHRKEMEDHSIRPIDLIAVNLYPFEETVSKGDVDLDAALEQIDVGGPSLIRAAAKNHMDVIVLVDPSDYDRVLSELRETGDVTERTRQGLALKAFHLTSAYDSVISQWLGRRFCPDSPWTDSLRLRYEKVYDTRYGENPHQKGAYFKDPSFRGVSVASSEVLWGKELSFNNIYDIDAATDILMEFPEDPCCVIIKHNNPSGVAVAPEGSVDGSRIAKAFQRAFDSDPLSAYGGIVGMNRECDLPTAELINQRFFEVVIAPTYSMEALCELKKKKNLRIIRTGSPIVDTVPPDQRFVKIKGGLLVQTMDWPLFDPGSWNVVTKKAPDDRELKDLVFATHVVKHVKSNCVVMAKDLCTVGVGAGQMSRVDSCFMAAHKAGASGKGAVLSSDAFFPFRDGIDITARSGVSSIAQPGGSIRDKEVIEAADENGLSMVFTGIRLFKH